MKTFIVVEKELSKGQRRYEIFSVNRNKPHFIAENLYRPAATQGVLSEAMNLLINLGYIPKKVKKLSESEWCGEGYYCPEVEKKGYRIINI